MLTPQQQAAAIVAHYLKHLAKRTGMRWSMANERDMALLVELLGCEPVEDTIPAYEAPVVSDRVTQTLERADYGDPNFARWRGRRYDEEYDR